MEQHSFVWENDGKNTICSGKAMENHHFVWENDGTTGTIQFFMGKQRKSIIYSGKTLEKSPS